MPDDLTLLMWLRVSHVLYESAMHEGTNACATAPLHSLMHMHAFRSCICMEGHPEPCYDMGPALVLSLPTTTPALNHALPNLRRSAGCRGAHLRGADPLSVRPERPPGPRGQTGEQRLAVTGGRAVLLRRAGLSRCRCDDLFVCEPDCGGGRPDSSTDGVCNRVCHVYPLHLQVPRFRWHASECEHGLCFLLLQVYLFGSAAGPTTLRAGSGHRCCGDSVPSAIRYVGSAACLSARRPRGPRPMDRAEQAEQGAPGTPGI